MPNPVKSRETWDITITVQYSTIHYTRMYLACKCNVTVQTVGGGGGDTVMALSKKGN